MCSAGGANKITNGLPEDLGEKIAAVPGVESVVGGLLDMISFHDEGIMGVLLNGWPADCPLFSRLTVQKGGRKLEAGDTSKIMIGRVLAANLDKKVGDTIELYGSEPFEVVAVYESPIVFENGGAVVLLPELQRLMKRPNEVTGFTIIAKKPIDEKGIRALCTQVAAIQTDPALEVKPAMDFVKSVREIRLSQGVAWVTSAIAIIIGAIGMLNTMIMSVFERTKEIGTLRAIGWKRSRIVRMVVGESVILSIAGAFVGSLCGVLLVKFLSTLPNASGIARGYVSPAVIAQGFLVAIFVGILGAIYPALWSANLLPTEALRGK